MHFRAARNLVRKISSSSSLKVLQDFLTIYEFIHDTEWPNKFWKKILKKVQKIVKVCLHSDLPSIWRKNQNSEFSLQKFPSKTCWVTLYVLYSRGFLSSICDLGPLWQKKNRPFHLPDKSAKNGWKRGGVIDTRGSNAPNNCWMCCVLCQNRRTPFQKSLPYQVTALKPQ